MIYKPFCSGNAFINRSFFHFAMVMPFREVLQKRWCSFSSRCHFQIRCILLVVAQEHIPFMQVAAHTSSPIVYSNPHVRQVVWLPKLFCPASMYACVLGTAFVGDANSDEVGAVALSETAFLRFLVNGGLFCSDDLVGLAIASSLRFAAPCVEVGTTEAVDGLPLRGVKRLGFVAGAFTRRISAALMSMLLFLLLMLNNDAPKMATFLHLRSAPKSVLSTKRGTKVARWVQIIYKQHSERLATK